MPAADSNPIKKVRMTGKTVAHVKGIIALLEALIIDSVNHSGLEVTERKPALSGNEKYEA